MSNNSLGKYFVVTSFGESHGEAVGAVIDGCPAGFEINRELLQKQLDKRRPGQSSLSSQRNELDQVRIISGLSDNKTTGAPICLLIDNKDHKKKDYESIKNVYRPSHADFTYDKKYGNRDVYGGGRSSARITAGWVAAGAIASQILKEQYGVKVTGFVSSIHTVNMPQTLQTPDFEDIEKSEVRCPDLAISDKICASSVLVLLPCSQRW